MVADLFECIDDFLSYPALDVAGEASMVEEIGGRLSGGRSLEPALAYFNRFYAG